LSNSRVHPEVVLEGDGGERLVLALDLHLLLGLHRLVEAVGPAAAGHEAARELVDDHDLAVLDDVVHVALEEAVGPKRLVHVVEHVHVGGLPEVLDPQDGLHVGHALLGEGDGLRLLVDDVVARLLELRALLRLLLPGDAGARLQLRDDLVDAVVLVGRLLGGAADDQGSAGLVDEDGVDLVDDGEVVAALDVHPQVELHVVAEVVEAELVVGPVGDVGAVGLLPLPVVHVVLDDAHREAEEAVETSHPLRVALGQVVVDGDDVHALALEGVQVGGEGGDEGLALAGLHLRDHAPVQRNPPDQLHVEVAHSEDAPSRLAGGGEDLGQEIVEGRSFSEAPAELHGPCGELGVGQILEPGLEGPDVLDEGAKALELPLVLRPDDSGEDVVDHVRARLSPGRTGNPRPAAPLRGSSCRGAPAPLSAYQPPSGIGNGARPADPCRPAGAGRATAPRGCSLVEARGRPSRRSGTRR
jgi:hypothetical protein